MNEQYIPCEHEKPLNDHLVVCHKPKGYCEYHKHYSGVLPTYCMRRHSWQVAQRMFDKMKKELEERTLGET